MKNTKEVKEYLSQYQSCLLRVNSLIDEIKNIKELTDRITATFNPSVVASNTVNDRNKYVDTYLDLENRLKSEIVDLEKIRGGVKTALCGIDDEKLKYIGVQKYINDKTLSQIAKEMNYSEQYTRAMHSKLLKNIMSEQQKREKK